MSVNYVYTVSDRAFLVSEACRSIKSLRKYADRNEIIVFLTPPGSASGRARLSELAIVKEVDNLTKPFVFKKERGPAPYGEKVHLCDVNSPNVIFLDADTVVKKDLTPLLNGDFDFSARRQFPTREEETREVERKAWLQLFRERGKKAIPMPNAGFMIFKNYLHSRIKEEWLRLVNDDNLPNACLSCNPKEQTALALTVSGSKIRWLTVKEHAFRWREEEGMDSCVVHGFRLLPERFDKVRLILPRGLRQRVHKLANRLTK